MMPQFDTGAASCGQNWHRGKAVMSKNFASLILIAMVLGILVGYACHEAFPDPKTTTAIAGYISLFTDLFLRLIKMIIAPLVLSTLIVGITHMGSGAALGRIGAKTMGWFVAASLVSLLIGMLMVNLLQPAQTSTCRCPTPAPRLTSRPPA
jgi:Na+/H+-dicarboxylate symporter